MFNFLFDGKIGDILAPIQSPVQQFHLAIQHHRTGEIDQMIASGTVEIGNTTSTGYADIHVACRYNNKHALTLILQRGIPVSHPDRSGNTPLHYAAKYGHVDLCRLLIESNGSPAVRNSLGQSPYDISESHVVRQYLLPLQLAIERDMNPAGLSAIPPPPTALGMGNYFAPNSNSSSPGIPIYSTGPPALNTAPPTPIYAPPPLAPHAAPQVVPSQSSVGYIAPVPPPTHSSSPANISTPLGRPSVFVNTSATLPVASSSSPSAPLSESSSPSGIQHSTSGNDLQNSSPVSAPPAAQWAPVIPTVPSSGSQSVPTSRRIIQPDGFESSASKVALKEKYGHTKIISNVAPPPVFATFSSPPSAMAPPPSYPQPLQTAPPPHPAYLQNRYVAYDPNAPPAPYPVSQTMSYAPQPVPQPVMNSIQYPPAIQIPSEPPTPPMVNQFPSQSRPPPSTPQPPSTPTDTLTEINLTTPSPTTAARLNQSPRIHINADNVLFNPVTDRVVSATSSSSAIL